jgi:hypothetical protein
MRAVSARLAPPYSPVQQVPLVEGMVQLAARLGDRDDEAQVEEELERSGGPVSRAGIFCRHGRTTRSLT